jgi:hypothetical protein
MSVAHTYGLPFILDLFTSYFLCLFTFQLVVMMCLKLGFCNPGFIIRRGPVTFAAINLEVLLAC